MTEEKRNTVGKYIYERMQKNSEEVPAEDLQRAMQEDWPEKIVNQFNQDAWYCLEKGYDESYIHIFLRKPKYLPGAVDVKFISRITPPAMTPSSLLYKCNHQTEKIDFIWALPDLEIIKEVVKDPYNIEYQDVLPYCQAFMKGEWAPLNKD